MSDFHKQSIAADTYSKTVKECEHNWVFLETRQRQDKSGYGTYERDDEFYCSKCLELKVIRRKEECKHSSSIGRPKWFTAF